MIDQPLRIVGAPGSPYSRIDCVINGRRWTQRPFPYQGKCLRWLREAYAALAVEDRATVEALLTSTGCERLFR